MLRQTKIFNFFWNCKVQQSSHTNWCIVLAKIPIMQACNVLNTFQNFSFGQPMHIMISKQNKKYFFNAVSKSVANSLCWIDDLPTHSYMHEWQLYPQEKSLLSPWCQNLLMCYPMNSKMVWDIIFHSYNLDLALELSWKMPIRDNIHQLYIFQMHLLNQITHKFIHNLYCTPKSRKITSTDSKTRGPLPYLSMHT